MGDHTLGLERAAERAETGAWRQLEARTLERARDVLIGFDRPMVAFSGGKDAIVTMHLLHRATRRPLTAYSDNGFMYERAKADAKRLADEQGWDVHFGQRRTWDWLAAHPHHVFNENTAQRSTFFSLNHQDGVRRHAAAIDADLVVFGRRHQENSIRSVCYPVRGRFQFHPLAEWTTEDVWAYFAAHAIPVPWLYTTFHGRWIGYNPFTSVRPSVIGSPDCWAFVDGYDPTIRPQWEAALSRRQEHHARSR